MLNYFFAQACNNAWANHRILQACGALGEDECFAARTGFFPSIMRTLNHTLMVDWFYVSALEGACEGYAAFERALQVKTMGSLVTEQAAVDQRLMTVCRNLRADDLGATVALVRDSWTQMERVDTVLLHLFQHQIHHRGQVHAMLSGTSVAPPQLDEFFLGDEVKAVREARSSELAQLGVQWEAVWEHEL